MFFSNQEKIYKNNSNTDSTQITCICNFLFTVRILELIAQSVILCYKIYEACFIRSSTLHLVTLFTYICLLFTYISLRPLRHNVAHLNLMFIAFKGFHDHQDSFKLSIKPAILTIEPIHTAGYITEKFEELRLLLRTSKLLMTHMQVT